MILEAEQVADNSMEGLKRQIEVLNDQKEELEMQNSLLK